MDAVLREAQDALNKARMKLIIEGKAPFIANLALLAENVFESVGTAATDGKKILIDPDYFIGLTKNTRVFLLAHEAMHIALSHPIRMVNALYPRILNIAQDIYINNFLKDLGFECIEGAWLDWEGETFPGLCTEEIYEELLKRIPPDSELRDPEGTPSGTVGKDMIGDTIIMPNPVSQHETEGLILQAYEASKQQGNTGIPQELQQVLESFYKPKIPFKKLLSRVVSKAVKGSRLWNKPNRRYMPDYFIPCRETKISTGVNFCLDISSSVTDEEIDSFISDVTYVLKQRMAAHITVVQFNHAIVSINKVKDFNEIKSVQFYKAGGTRIEPVLEYLTENKSPLNFIFTDGEFRLQDFSLNKTPIVWCIINNKHFNSNNPRHRVIHYEIQK